MLAHRALASFHHDEATPMARRFKTLAEVEADHILDVLAHHNWNKSHASEVLGIARSTLVRKIQNLQKQGYEIRHRNRGGIPRSRRSRTG